MADCEKGKAGQTVGLVDPVPVEQKLKTAGLESQLGQSLALLLNIAFLVNSPTKCRWFSGEPARRGVSGSSQGARNIVVSG